MSHPDNEAVIRAVSERVEVLVRDGEHFLRALWFNQPHMKKRLPTGTDVLLSFQAKLRGGRWQMTHPRVQIMDESEETSSYPTLPVSSSTALPQPY